MAIYPFFSLKIHLTYDFYYDNLHCSMKNKIRFSMTMIWCEKHFISRNRKQNLII